MKRVLTLFLLLLSDVALLGAQTFRGSINGTVTDPSGAFVPNAQVQAIETATSVNHNTITTADGQFSVDRKSVV
jgi:hypothetical protein